MSEELRRRARLVAWPHKVRFVGCAEYEKVVKSAIGPETTPTMHAGLAKAGYENVQDEDRADTFVVLEDRP